jgi:hypothetical protein
MRWLFIVLLFVTSTAAQTIDVTGNLVNNTQTATTVTSTWQNAKPVNELTCWQAGDPNCSAGQPYLRPDGSINFSYSYTELYQIVNVSKALPNSGTGLVTTGFIFSWRSKNGNSWDDARVDQLNAYVQGYTKSGKWIENFGYNLNFQHDWTDFTWSQDWSKLRRPDELANVLFGFNGKDNNYWMGPYGPEITNVNFRLRYKPDPCVNNPLYSPDCPKFQETLAKNNESYTIDNATVKPTTVEYTIDSTNNVKPVKSADTWQDDEEYRDRQENYVEYDYNRLIDTLFKIEDNQQREQNIAVDAANTAISETDKISQQTVRQAEQIASKTVKQSIENVSIGQHAAADTKQKDNKQEQSLALFQPSTINVQILFQPSFSQQLNLLQAPAPVETQQIGQQNTEQQIKPSNNQQTNNLVQQVAAVQQTTNTPTTVQQLQQSSATNSTNTQVTLVNQLASQTVEIPQHAQSFLTNKADPINSLLEAKQLEQDSKTEQSTQQVKANTPDNDLANGVSLTQLAVAPANYNQYLNLVLRDAAFYPSREVYRNQRTVDNARALRQLSSDRLHKQMVDQQYGGSRE